MNSKVNKWCAVPECTNTSIKTSNKVFVHVPKKKKIRVKWFKLARLNPNDVVMNSLYFCEDHFDLPNDMENYMQYHVMGSVSQVRMKPGCMPTKFLCQPDRKSQTSDTTERPYVAKKRRKVIIEECLKQYEEKSKVTEQSSSEAIASSSSVVPVASLFCPEQSESYKTEVPDAKDPLPSIAVCDMFQQIKTQEEIVDPTMNDAPPRFDPESVCRCCLSPSRSLGPLSCSPPWAGTPSVCARVCWECAATLARACRFRERVNAAEAALRRASETQITSEIKSLSTLTSYTKDTYDYVFEFDYRLNETHKPKSGQRKQKLQVRVESENTMDVFLPHTIEDQEIITQYDIKKEPEYSEVKIEITELFPDHGYCDTTANAATTDKNDAASDNNDAGTDSNDAATESANAAFDINDPTAEYKDATINNSGVITGNIDAATDNDDAASDSNDSATDMKDATSDNDEPLVHVNVTQDLDNPLENEYEVKYLTEEEMRQTRFAYSQSSYYKNRRFKCNMCICFFHTHKLMKKHINERHGWHAGRYVCRVCQQRFAAPGALAEHCRQHYVSYCCRRCGLTDRRLGSMKLHVRGHAPRQPEPKGESLATRRRAARPKYICDKCGLKYLWRFQIVRHFRSGKCFASPAKPTLWRECGICYETVNYPIWRHYASCHHPTERPRCRLCDKELTNQKGYVCHIQGIHMPRKYKCRFCNKLFSRKNSRQLHIDMNHVRTQKHKCTECEKAFLSTVSLKAHLKRVHRKVRTKLCTYCGKTCDNLSTWTEHLRTHTGERPYQCAHCHRAFAQRSNILSHIKSVHKEVLMRQPPAN